MSKVFIEETSLTAIGDAIRAKTGSSDLLSIPSGMVDAIASIEAGGGGSSSSSAYTKPSKDILTLLASPTVDSVPWDYINHDVTILKIASLFASTAIRAVDLPNVTSFGDWSRGCGTIFEYCRSLKDVNLSELTIMYAGGAFADATGLKYVNLPKFQYNDAYYTFRDTGLRYCVLPSCTQVSIGTFARCGNLQAVILSGETVATLNSTDAFLDVTMGGTTGCYIYVPSALVDTYKAETNWATYADYIKPIEGSGFEEAGKWIGHVTAEETTVSKQTESSSVIHNCLTGLSAPNATSINVRNQANLVYVNAPKLTLINQGNFLGCTSLATLETPKLQTIKADGLSGCTALEKLVFSASSKTNIYDEALRNCSALTTITLPNQEAVASLGTHTGINANLTYYVPSSLLASYQETYPDFTFATIEDHLEVL